MLANKKLTLSSQLLNFNADHSEVWYYWSYHCHQS